MDRRTYLALGAVLALAIWTAGVCGCEQESESEEEAPPASSRTLRGPMTGVYKFTDDRGVIHFVDDLQKVPPRYRKRVSHPTGGSVSIVPSTNIDELLRKHGLSAKNFRGRKQPAAQHGNVFVYSTSWCPACKRAKAYLRQRGVEFVEKDIEHNRENLREMLQKSGGARGVPVIDVRGKILRGFNSRALDLALNQS